MALNQTYTNAVQIMLRDLEKEFAVSMNPFEKIFNVGKNDKADQFIDFLGEIQTAELDNSSAAKLLQIGDSDTRRVAPTQSTDATFNSPYSRNRETPEAVQLQWKRRSGVGEGRQLHISVPRADAQVTGRSMDKLMTDYKQRFMQKFKEFFLEMFVKQLTAPVYENPQIAGFGANAGKGDRVAFPSIYQHILAGSVNGKNMTTGVVNFGTDVKYAAPLSVTSFYYLTASLRNSVFSSATEESLNRNTGIDTGRKKCTILINETGYADWKLVNHGLIDNRDYHGKSVILGAEIHEWQEYRFMVLPDRFLPAYSEPAAITDNASFGNAVTFPNPRTWDNQESLLLGAGGKGGSSNTRGNGNGNSSGTASYARAHGLGRAIVFDPRAFIFFRPAALEVPSEMYKDFTKSMERFIYKQVHLESIRIWDPLVRELYYTRRNVRSGSAVIGGGSGTAPGAMDTATRVPFKVN